MIRILLGMACLLLPVLSHFAHAQVTTLPAVETLTLQQAIDLALARNPELAAAHHEAQAVAAGITQAGLRPNPTLTAGIEDTRRNTRTSTLEISQTIELGGKRAARVSAAARAHEAALATLRGREVEIRAAVVAAFFSVAQAQTRQQLAQEALAIAQQGFDAAARRVAAGKVSPVDETRAQIAALDVQLEVAQAAGELTQAQRTLAAMLGQDQRQSGNPDAQPFVPSFARVVVPVDGSDDRLPEGLSGLENQLHAQLIDAPAMQQAQAEVLHWQAQVELERRKRHGDIAVNVGVQRNAELGRNQALVSVSIPLPLFDRNQGNLLQTLRRTDQARAELESTRLRLQSELAQAFAAWRSARAQVRLLAQDILPAAQSVHDATVQGFEFGKFDFLAVLDAQRTLLDARVRHLQALFGTHAAVAQIEQIVGRPIPVRPSDRPFPS